MAKRVMMSVLPDEPLDGSGRVCVHLVVSDERGPFTEPHFLHPVFDAQGQPVKQQVVARPTRARLACSRTRTVAPVTRGGVTRVTSRTSSVEAVNCPKCRASSEYAEMIQRLEATEAGR